MIQVHLIYMTEMFVSKSCNHVHLLYTYFVMLLAFLFTDFLRTALWSLGIYIKTNSVGSLHSQYKFLISKCEDVFKKARLLLNHCFAEGDFVKWSIVVLKQFLSERNVLVPAGNRKTSIVRKCLLTQELELPVLSNFMKKDTEIAERRLQKLTIDSIKLPFPEEIKKGWMHDFVYLPNVTVENLKTFAEKSAATKAYKEGLNLNFDNHVFNIELNNISPCIKYFFICDKVVPQTRMSEDSYSVWVCLNDESDVLTGECGCIAGYSESCKHDFALLHSVEQHVTHGHNKTCTSVKQK